MKAAYRCVAMSLLSAVLLGASAMAQQTASTAPAVPRETVVTAKELAARATSGVAYQVPGSAGPQVLMIRRDKTADAEVHMAMDDTIIIEQGTAKFRVGGTITGNHEIRPTEWRGGEMSGAREYTLSAGDLLLIPAGVPHQAVVVSGTLMYLAIKTPKR